MSDLWTQVERIFDLPGEMARFFGVFDSWVDGWHFQKLLKEAFNINLVLHSLLVLNF